MSAINPNRFAPPTLGYRQVSAPPVRTSADETYRDCPRAGTAAFSSDVTPVGASDDAAPAAWIARLVDLFTQLFNRLQSFLHANEPAPAPKKTEVPPVQPALVAKRSEHIPGLSAKRNGAKPNNIWNGFRQGNNGNCVTVSAIKAAMMKFGQSPTDIYKSVEKVTDGYKVVMRDDYALTLTHAELARAIRGSSFVGLTDPEMLKDAHFLFACSVKRAQLEDNDGWASRSFEAAIRTLNDGEDEDWTNPGEGFKRLGLAAYMKRVPARAFADKSLIGMVNRRGHSVAVVDGCEEIYGSKGRRPTVVQAAIALV